MRQHVIAGTRGSERERLRVERRSMDRSSGQGGEGGEARDDRERWVERVEDLERRSISTSMWACLRQSRGVMIRACGPMWEWTIPAQAAVRCDTTALQARSRQHIQALPRRSAAHRTMSLPLDKRASVSRTETDARDVAAAQTTSEASRARARARHCSRVRVSIEVLGWLWNLAARKRGSRLFAGPFESLAVISLRLLVR